MKTYRCFLCGYEDDYNEDELAEPAPFPCPYCEEGDMEEV